MASRYSLISYDSDEERERNPEDPPVANLMSACVFTMTLLENSNLRHAVMGGFGLALRGSPRRTRGVDIAVETRMMNLWPILEPQSRLINPDTRQIEGVMKIFVKTGPGYDQCGQRRDIELDLIICGANGSPRTLDGHRSMLSATSQSGNQALISVVSLLYAMRNKLRAYSARQAQRDIHDIIWIISEFEADVRKFRAMLDLNAVLSRAIQHHRLIQEMCHF